MTVAVLDAAGEIIGAGRTRSLEKGDQDGDGIIARAATLAQVMFQVQVGTRGDRRLSKSELDDEQWFVQFILDRDRSRASGYIADAAMSGVVDDMRRWRSR